jgi:hypothetical protein
MWRRFDHDLFAKREGKNEEGACSDLRFDLEISSERLSEVFTDSQA